MMKKALFLSLLLLPALFMSRSLFAEEMAPAPAPGGPRVAEPRIDPAAEQAPAPVTQGARAFFEPTQADFDSHAKAIVQQQDAYISAKDGKRWKEARSLALFYFVRAWLFNNEAFAIISSKEGWTNISELKRAQDLYEMAQVEIGQAEIAGHHMDQVKACSRMVERNSALIGPQISALLGKAKL